MVGQGLELPDVLRTIVQTALEMVDAEYGALGVLDDTGTVLSEFVHVGMSPEQVAAIGRLPEGRGVLGLLIKEPTAVRLDDIASHPEAAGFPEGHPLMTSFLGVPVAVAGRPYGNLYLAEKRRAPEFSAEDEDMVSALALAAGLAIEKARVHARLRELTLAEERERIARDLHDTTIKRLFAVGLSLQGAQRLVDSPEASERLQGAVDELDGTIRQIRSTVFSITRPARRVVGMSLWSEILQAVDEAVEGSGVHAEVDLDGPIDRAVDESTGEHLLLSLRQSLALFLDRDSVSTLRVVVAVGDDLRIEVSDDSAAPFEPSTELDALVRRARRLGGDCWVEPVPSAGMRLVWKLHRLR